MAVGLGQGGGDDDNGGGGRERERRWAVVVARLCACVAESGQPEEYDVVNWNHILIPRLTSIP